MLCLLTSFSSHEALATPVSLACFAPLIVPGWILLPPCVSEFACSLAFLSGWVHLKQVWDTVL